MKVRRIIATAAVAKPEAPNCNALRAVPWPEHGDENRTFLDLS